MRLNLRSTGLLLALALFLAAGNGYASSPTQAANVSDTAQTTIAGGPQLAPKSIVVISPEPKSEPWFELKLSDVLLVAVTAGLWYATNRLVTGADSNARRQLRPYIGFTYWQGAFNSSTKTLTLALHYKNFGVTPAYKLARSAQVEIEAADGRKYVRPFPQNVGADYVNPGQELSAEILLSLDDTEARQMGAGQLKITLALTWNYFDTFGFIRTTKYQFYGPGSEGKVWRIMGEGNEPEGR